MHELTRQLLAAYIDWVENDVDDVETVVSKMRAMGDAFRAWDLAGRPDFKSADIDDLTNEEGECL